MSVIERSDVERRVPTLQLIEDEAIRAETARLTADAPEYFWDVPSSNRYHHPICRQQHGLWVHTLMLSTAVEEFADSYETQGLIDGVERDYAHAAAILHDQRKRGDPANPSSHAVGNHDLRMAQVIRESSLPDQIADAVSSHMGPWDDGPEPKTPFRRLVHLADMTASSEHILPGVQGPLPEELEDMDLVEVDLC